MSKKSNNDWKKRDGVVYSTSNDFAFNFENVKVYPNPSSGIFQLQIQEEVQIEVYDLMGKMFLQKNVQAGAAFFDISQNSS